MTDTAWPRVSPSSWASAPADVAAVARTWPGRSTEPARAACPSSCHTAYGACRTGYPSRAPRSPRRTRLPERASGNANVPMTVIASQQAARQIPQRSTATSMVRVPCWTIQRTGEETSTLATNAVPRRTAHRATASGSWATTPTERDLAGADELGVGQHRHPRHGRPQEAAHGGADLRCAHDDRVGVGVLRPHGRGASTWVSTRWPVSGSRARIVPRLGLAAGPRASAARAAGRG